MNERKSKRVILGKFTGFWTSGTYCLPETSDTVQTGCGVFSHCREPKRTQHVSKRCKHWEFTPAGNKCPIQCLTVRPCNAKGFFFLEHLQLEQNCTKSVVFE